MLRRSYQLGLLLPGGALLVHLFDLLRANQAIQPGPRRDQRGVDLLVRDLRRLAVPLGDRGFEPLAVAGFPLVDPLLRFGAAGGWFARFQRSEREVGLVMRASRFVAS